MKKFAYLLTASCYLVATENSPNLHGIIEAGPIYWTASLDTQNFAYQNNQASDKGSFPWRPGFKVALGAAWDEMAMSLQARYTWYKTNDSQSLSSSSATIIPQISIEGSSIEEATYAYQKNLLRFNTVDLELGYNFVYRQTAEFRTYLGAKGAIITANTTTEYSVEQDVAKLIQQNIMRGLGLRIGIDMNYTVYKPLSLVGDLAFSTLWDRFSIQRKDFVNSTKTLYLKQDPTEMTPVIETRIGFLISQFFSQSRYRLSGAILWENQLLFGASQAILLTNSSGSSNISLMGVTALLRLDF
jgi:hypothetical protein